MHSFLYLYLLEKKGGGVVTALFETPVKYKTNNISHNITIVGLYYIYCFTHAQYKVLFLLNNLM